MEISIVSRSLAGGVEVERGRFEAAPRIVRHGSYGSMGAARKGAGRRKDRPPDGPPIDPHPPAAPHPRVPMQLADAGAMRRLVESREFRQLISGSTASTSVSILFDNTKHDSTRLRRVDVTIG